MNLLGHSKLFLKRNASTILTCAGGVGVVATAVLAVKATPKAMALLDHAEEEKGESLTKLEVVKTAGPAYIPTVLVGVSTIACIFGANVLNKRQQASIMSAYALLDNSYKQYKDKVKELYGEEFNQDVISEIAKDNYEENDELADDSDGKQLFYDYFSGRYFRSTVEDVQRAEYRINRNLVTRDYATVNEFYEFLGLPGIDGGDEIGWSLGGNFERYWQQWIDFTHEKTIIDDGMEEGLDGLECSIIIMQGEPTYGFYDYV